MAFRNDLSDEEVEGAKSNATARIAVQQGHFAHAVERSRILSHTIDMSANQTIRPFRLISSFIPFCLLLNACATLPLAPVDARGNATKLLGKAYPGVQNRLTSRDSAWVEATLKGLTLREKAAQLIMPWVGGEYAAVGSPEYEQVRKWVEEDGVGGLVLSIGMPLSYAAKINEMQRHAKLPLLIASDMENGPGMRMGNIYAFPTLLAQGGGTVFPPVMSLGAAGSEDLAYQLGEVLGREARAVGVHINFGPVLDVNSNPINPIINTRSFGEDPAAVSALATAYIRGARKVGLMTTGKHFPGHGDTGTDSHLSLPVITANCEALLYWCQ